MIPLTLLTSREYNIASDVAVFRNSSVEVYNAMLNEISLRLKQSCTVIMLIKITMLTSVAHVHEL